ncbi:MAG: gfo/Idh/MocA family oxidoreductase, partial [Candidatus Brocadiia bacterium]
MSRMTRRSFMKGSLLSAAGISVASTLASSARAQVRGANDDIRVAVVGFRGKGKGHVESFHKLDGVRVVALCDVDKTIIDREVKKFTDRNEKVDTYTDVRKLLEDKNIDAIVTATPNHWHALVTIWACQAGKDVYVEKPIHHSVSEGAPMMAAAKKYNRIVQSGLQGRSDPSLAESAEFLQAGNLGKILYAHCLCYNRRESIGKYGVQAVPDYIDYDLWCGPAPLQPLKRKTVHYDWHWFWETGNSDLVNQSIHDMDLCRWLIGANDIC